MAALTFTAASVLLTGGQQESGIAGGTVARGNVVRKNATNQFVAAANDSLANSAAYGVALNDAASGQPVTVAPLKSGGTLAGVASNCAAGKVLVLGTAGAILPVDDIAGGEFVTVVGVGVNGSSFALGSLTAGVAAAGAVS
jgi:hypothetical protein